MFREMRRSKQKLTDEEAVAILMSGETGVLALLGDDGYPYALPINYVYADGNIYMHSAKTGHKIDAIKAYEKASFCVIDRADVVPQDYATDFRSVIAFGKVRLLEDEGEKLRTLRKLGDRFNPGHDDALEAEIAKEFARVAMIELSIEHLSGKQSKSLLQQQKSQQS